MRGVLKLVITERIAKGVKTYINGIERIASTDYNKYKRLLIKRGRETF